MPFILAMNVCLQYNSWKYRGSTVVVLQENSWLMYGHGVKPMLVCGFFIRAYSVCMCVCECACTYSCVCIYLCVCVGITREGG